MPSSLTGEDRAKVIANNRSLRIIKNELEALSERDSITDEQYATIMGALPAEASLHNTVLPIPGQNQTPTISTTSPPPLTDNFASMSINDRNPLTGAPSLSPHASSPPAYNQVPAALPPRNPPPPAHTELAHVIALYRYNDPDPRDLNFEPGDHISVTEYCNAEWWQGKNIRTGNDGIFPKNYVRIENGPSSFAQQQQPQQPQQPQYNHNEKASGFVYGSPNPQQSPLPGAGGGGGGYFPGQQQQQQQRPGPSSPYDTPVPPMAITDQQPPQLQQHHPSKVGEMGKKFGRKLGNAAIFGAGATLGSDVVNSIF